MFTPHKGTMSPMAGHKAQQELLWTAQLASDQTCMFAGTLLGASVVRVRFLRHVEHYQPTRYLLADGGPGTLPYHSWIVAKGDEPWQVSLDEAQARAHLAPYLRGFALAPNSLRLTLPLHSNEHIFGLGERTGSLNKRGQSFPIWNTDPAAAYDAQTVTMYASIPFYLSVDPHAGRTHGVLVDHCGRVEVDFGQRQSEQTTLTVPGDSLVVYFLSGPTPDAVMRQYAELTGRMTLPPRWVLGHHQCRWSYETEQQVREVAANLRAKKHPTDAIWLDIDYMDGFRDFTWNGATFPQPEALITELQEQGLRTVTIVDPGVKIDPHYFVDQQGQERGYFCQLADGTLFEGNVWPGACHFPDFSRAEVRRWWGDLQSGLLNAGVSAIWDDMNEPALFDAIRSDTNPEIHVNTMNETVQHLAGGAQAPHGPDGPTIPHALFHNAYGMQMARASFEGLIRDRPELRPFVLTRSGTAGIQRYAGIWTGDNGSDWPYLGLGLTMCLNLSMSGVPFVGVDIGGFWNATNGELLVRFAQLGALLPFCRNHNSKGNPDQEPWAFGEPYESAYRTAIETRYRLLPHLYTLLQQACAEGIPLIRPLYYHYPQDPEAVQNETEFLLGEQLLAAPILEAGATSRRVYLPAGTWFDYWSGERYAGSSWHEIAAPLDRWPLLVRENAIVPTGPLMQSSDEQPCDPLTLSCWLTSGGQATYTLYEDDGQSPAYQQGAFALTQITCAEDNGRVSVTINEQHAAYQPPRTRYELRVHLNGELRQTSLPVGSTSEPVWL